MNKIGIICEYNPFHNGHLYHIKKIKEMYPDSMIVLIMSGNFTQRGDLSVLTKWDKCEIALKNNIDLVIELPIKFATSSADMFADGAIDILNHLDIDYLIFGSESNDTDNLYNLANFTINNQEYNKLVNNYVKNGLSYASATFKALNDLTNKTLDKPNDILAFCYIRRIIETNSKIKPISIKRNDDYNSEKLDNICSARAIRKALRNQEDIKNYVPDITYKYLTKHNFFLDDYFPLIKYKIINEIDNLDKYSSIDTNLNNRIRKHIFKSNNLETFIQNIKSKNYTYNKLKRICLYILLGITKEVCTNKNIEYIRILGFNQIGQKYLNSIKNNINIPIITNYSNSKNLLDFDLKTIHILSLILPKEEQLKLIEDEYKHKPIINSPL